MESCICGEVDVQNDALDCPGAFPHRLPGQHRWRGVLYHEAASRDTLQKLDDFDIQDDDFLICGYPKSGTTWLQEMAYLVVHNGDVNLCNQTPNFLRVPQLEDRRSIGMCRNQASPRMFRSHLRYRDLPSQIRSKAAKIMHIRRNPKDVAVSYFHFYRSLKELGNFDGTWDEFLKMFMSAHVVAGDWFDHQRDWWSQKDNPNILFFQYEELWANPLRSVMRIAEFCGKQLSREVVSKIISHCSFESMKQNPMTNSSKARNINPEISPFMRVGKVGDSTNYFTAFQHEYFDKLCKTKINGMGDGKW